MGSMRMATDEINAQLSFASSRERARSSLERHLGPYWSCCTPDRSFWRFPDPRLAKEALKEEYLSDLLGLRRERQRVSGGVVNRGLKIDI